MPLSDIVSRLNDADVKRLVVGYSGGLDSHVLLHLVKHANPGPPVHALHVNHGLSDDADRWQDHCGEVCRNLDIPFSAMNVQVETGRGSLEENARTARFAAFQQFLAPGDLLLLAHHLDDQIETLLFYLFRGSSIFGVKGMPRERALGQAALFRPLLDVPRKELAAYARANGLNWVEDASNLDVGPDRNYLRHEVIPVIRARWPNVDQVLSSAIDRDAEMVQLVDDYGRLDLDALMAEDGGVNLKPLREMPIARFKNVMRSWIRRLDLPWPGDSVLEEAFTALVTADEDAMPVLSWRGVALRRFQDRMYLTRCLQDHDISQFANLKPGETIDIAGGVLSTEKVKGHGLHVDKGTELTVRFRQGGERIRLARARTLKNLFQENSVPPWLRDRLPLVYLNDELVAIAGLPAWQVPAVVASDHAASGDDDGWLFSFNLHDRPNSH